MGTFYLFVTLSLLSDFSFIFRKWKKRFIRLYKKQFIWLKKKNCFYSCRSNFRLLRCCHFWYSSWIILYVFFVLFFLDSLNCFVLQVSFFRKWTRVFMNFIVTVECVEFHFTASRAKKKNLRHIFNDGSPRQRICTNNGWRLSRTAYHWKTVYRISLWMSVLDFAIVQVLGCFASQALLRFCFFVLFSFHLVGVLSIFLWCSFLYKLFAKRNNARILQPIFLNINFYLYLKCCFHTSVLPPNKLFVNDFAIDLWLKKKPRKKLEYWSPAKEFSFATTDSSSSEWSFSFYLMKNWLIKWLEWLAQ